MDDQPSDQLGETEYEYQRKHALDQLYEHALPHDAPGAWVRAAIDKERREKAQ